MWSSLSDRTDCSISIYISKYIKTKKNPLSTGKVDSHKLLLVAGLEPARGCPRGILSPLRLPIPPHQLTQYEIRIADPYMHTRNPSDSLWYAMDGGGFEPPKQFAADLQSVPFGHSGIHPC